MRPDEQLRRLAARQHGLVTSAQAHAIGLSGRSVQRRIARGEWERIRPRLLRATATPPSDDQRLMAAVLDAGPDACLSHWSAAFVWKIPGFDLPTIHVSRRRATSGRPNRSSSIHEPRSLPDHHVTTVRDIPLTNPTRTIFDLAGVVSAGKLERALDTAWSHRLVSGRTLHAMLHELAERGRTGIGVMRRLLDERPPDYRPMDSGTEVRAKQVLADAGIRGFDHQVDLGDDDEWLGRVDLVDRPGMAIIEIDSELHHGSLIDRQADQRRTERLEAAGYAIRRVSDMQVWHQPGALVRAAREARDEARRRGTSTASGT